jgi:hypothetical protein
MCIGAPARIQEKAPIRSACERREGIFEVGGVAHCGRLHFEAKRQHAASGSKTAPPKQSRKTEPPNDTSPVDQSAIDRVITLRQIMELIARTRDARKQAFPVLTLLMLAIAFGVEIGWIVRC